MRLNGSPVARARMKTASERGRGVASDWTSRTARKRRIDRSGSEPREQRAPDAFRKEEDEGHEDRPDHERPGLGEDREAVLEDEERRGADEGAEAGAGAAEQCHDDHLPRGRPVERLDRDDVEPEGVEGAGEPREEGGEDERQELDATRVIAARGGALAVLADRLEHGAEGRVEDALEGGDRRGDERQGEVVEGERRVERDRDAGERQRRQGDPAEAVVAAGPVGEVESDEVEELGERERQHREVDATPAQAEEADHRAARRREAEPRREPEPQRADLELRERDTGAIGAEPPVGGVAEGEQPRVAVEEVEAEGEEAVDQELRGERLVRHEVREDREDDEERDDGVGRDPASGSSHSMRPDSPKRPLGRTSRTSAFTMRGSREHARMMRPTLVFSRKTKSATSTTTVTPMTKRR